MKTSIGIACLLLALAATPIVAAPIGPAGSQAVVRAVGDCGDPCVISNSNGGRIVDFRAAAAAIQNGARKSIVIDGYCASACMTLAALARSKVCITSRAVFAYHKTNFNRPIPLASDMNRWINRNGGFPEFNGTPGVLPSQVAQSFWRQCKST
jgi:dienelactone hydrolase